MFSHCSCCSAAVPRCADYWWKIMNGTNNNNTASLLLAMQMPLALIDWWWWFYQIKIKYKIPLYEVHLFRNLSLAHVDCSTAARPPAQQQPAQSAAVRCADCRTSAAWCCRHRVSCADGDQLWGSGDRMVLVTWQCWWTMSRSRIKGGTTESGPPDSWHLVFFHGIPQEHSNISPGTIQIA